MKTALKLVLITLLLTTAWRCSESDVACTEIIWYEDLDGDGLGNPAVSESACEQPTGYVADNSDTDDTGGVFTLTSEAIVNGELLDAFKCETKTNDIENSIPLAWSNAPSTAGSFVINMIHYPNPNDLTNPNSYLLLWDIDPTVTSIEYGAADDGPWYMGSDKDGVAISYTSPCSQSAGTHEYTITIYALSETPTSLPQTSSLEVTYDVMMAAIESVTIIEQASLTFSDVN